MSSMAMTTISVDSAVRDRLKRFIGGGETYSDVLTRIMDKVEADRFFGAFEAAILDPDYPWVELDLDDEDLWG